MIPGMSDIGLKEWAVTVDALERGDQTILLRKGGIREDGRHFKVEHDQFFLYPGHFHEGEALLKPAYRDRFGQVESQDFGDVITLSVFAEIAEVIEITEREQVEALEPFHIWTADFVTKRFNWKPRHPLNLIILRAHILQQPQALMVMEGYAGCKSWVQFVEEYPVGVTSPAMPDRKFEAQAAAIREAVSAGASAR